MRRAGYPNYKERKLSLCYAQRAIDGKQALRQRQSFSHIDGKLSPTLIPAFEARFQSRILEIRRVDEMFFPVWPVPWRVRHIGGVPAGRKIVRAAMESDPQEPGGTERAPDGDGGFGRICIEGRLSLRRGESIDSGVVEARR